MTLYDQIRKSNPLQGVAEGVPADADEGLFVQGGTLLKASLADFPGGGGGGGGDLTTQVPVRSSLITMSADQSTGLAVGSPIKFDTSSGDHSVDPTTFRVTVKGGAVAFLEAAIYVIYSATSSSFVRVGWYDITAAAFVGQQGQGLRNVDTQSSSQQPTAVARVCPNVDTEYELRIQNLLGVTSVTTARSYATVVEMPAANGNISNVVGSASVTNGSSLEVTGLHGTDYSGRCALLGGASSAFVHVFINGNETVANYHTQTEQAKDGSLTSPEYASSYCGIVTNGKSGYLELAASVVEGGKVLIDVLFRGDNADTDLRMWRSAVLCNTTGYTEITSIKLVFSDSSTSVATPVNVASGWLNVIDPTIAQTGAPDLIRNTEYRVPGLWWQDPDSLADFYPVYRKTITTTLPNSTTKNEPHGISNFIFKSLKWDGVATDGTNILAIPYTTTTGANEIISYVDADDIIIITESNRSTSIASYVIEYSKSTDTPVTETETVGNGGGVTGSGIAGLAKSVKYNWAPTATNKTLTVPVTTITVLPFEDAVLDEDGLVTPGAAWKYTAPHDGLYRITLKAISNSLTIAAGNKVILGVTKNGAATYEATMHIFTAQAATTLELFIGGVGEVVLASGDYIQPVILSTAGGFTITRNNAFNYNFYITIEEVPS
jgi:hypothetical protein